MNHRVHEPITENDLKKFSKHISKSANDLITLLGVEDAIKLFNALCGAEISIPKSPCMPRSKWQWEYISNILGSRAMNKLAQVYGGTVLFVPTLRLIRIERRKSHIVSEFDVLTAKEPKGQGYSKSRAIVQLLSDHAPMTHRQIAEIVDNYIYAP